MSYCNVLINFGLLFQVQAIGLDLKATVCDQSSVNRSALRMMGVNKTKPYFVASNRNIYAIYDIPHVVKCLRNNLMKGRISTPEGIVDWAHVAKLYYADISSTTARATKLTERHIRPNGFLKMCVKLATQVFSHTVSTAMKTAVETGQLPTTALATATFLGKKTSYLECIISYVPTGALRW